MPRVVSICAPAGARNEIGPCKRFRAANILSLHRLVHDFNAASVLLAQSGNDTYESQRSVTTRDKGLIVHQIKLSEPAYEVTLKAVYNLGLITRRHELFPAVIQEAVSSFSGIPQKVLDDLDGLMPIKGDIRMFVRIKLDIQSGFEKVRSELNERCGAKYGTREAVIACCLMVAPRK